MHQFFVFCACICINIYVHASSYLPYDGSIQSSSSTHFEEIFQWDDSDSDLETKKGSRATCQSDDEDDPLQLPPSSFPEQSMYTPSKSISIAPKSCARFNEEDDAADNAADNLSIDGIRRKLERGGLTSMDLLFLRHHVNTLPEDDASKKDLLSKIEEYKNLLHPRLNRKNPFQHTI